MGLDMFLEKRTDVQNWSHSKNVHKLNIKFNGKERKDIKKKRVTAIVEDVAYWRKCWGVHNWLMGTCGDADGTGIYYMRIEVLNELLELCQLIVENGYEEEKGINIHEAKLTAKQLKPLLAENNTPEGAYGGNFYYHASW